MNGGTILLLCNSAVLTFLIRQVVGKQRHLGMPCGIKGTVHYFADNICLQRGFSKKDKGEQIIREWKLRTNPCWSKEPKKTGVEKQDFRNLLGKGQWKTCNITKLDGTDSVPVPVLEGV